MKKKLDIIVANPAGNITIMVLTPVLRKDYKTVAQKLLQLEGLNGEQVAFLLPGNEKNTFSKMEMCGLEFCGNASRAFALHKARCHKPPLRKLEVAVSGFPEPLTARIDPEAGYVEMDMPVPTELRSFSGKELSLNRDGILVSIDGISHLVLEDVAPVAETFEMLKDFIYKNYDPGLPAFGVMFCDTVNQLMTPVVYVKDVDTTYFEGSCASGTVAASCAMADSLPDGRHRFILQQPEGTLHTTVIKKKNQIEKITLGGVIALSDVVSVTLP